MVLVLKILLGAIGLLLLYLALNWIFMPKKIMKQHNIEASSNTGMNYLRGDIGGILLSGFIFIGMFLFEGGHQWLIPGIILLACVILGRLLSLIMDGKSKMGVQAIVVEVIIIGLLLVIQNLE